MTASYGWKYGVGGIVHAHAQRVAACAYVRNVVNVGGVKEAYAAYAVTVNK